MLLRVLLFAFLIATYVCGGSRLSARGQTAQKYPDNIQRNKPTGDASDDPEQESPHREMLKEMALKRE
ncbi:MAG: hypothetical protein QOD32_3705, partial [Pyrinomonadaceae bacterium]|nr:hypothetical protein [Pyrinomonadaceae bacterium]